MAKEVLIYGEIFSYSAREFIRAVEDAKGSDLTTRINSNGGDVDYGYGMIAKYKEFEGKKTVKVDGSAASMAAFFTLFADEVEALDVSSFTFHRAAYPEWIERDAEMMKGYREQTLTKANAELRAALESKVDADQWAKITGVTIDEMFSRDSRVDVLLTAQQAKQLGIVTKINALTAQKTAEIEARLLAMGEQMTGLRLAAKTEPKTDNQKPKTKAMTIETLKAEHPEVYAAAVNAGITQERDRVGAWAVFADVDVKAVTDGIKSGESMTATAQAEFSRKAFAASQVTALETNSPKTTATTEAPTTDPNANPELVALEAEIQKLRNKK
jgi:ATP-dependent Clp protease, protease subunit